MNKENRSEKIQRKRYLKMNSLKIEMVDNENEDTMQQSTVITQFNCMVNEIDEKRIKSS